MTCLHDSEKEEEGKTEYSAIPENLLENEFKGSGLLFNWKVVILNLIPMKALQFDPIHQYIQRGVGASDCTAHSERFNAPTYARSSATYITGCTMFPVLTLFDVTSIKQNWMRNTIDRAGNIGAQFPQITLLVDGLSKMSFKKLRDIFTPILKSVHDTNFQTYATRLQSIFHWGVSACM
jgi:hypothetical protein